MIEDTNGREVFEEADIAEVIAGYFQDIFTTRNPDDFSLVQDCLSRKFTAEMNTYLIAIPSNSEIRDAVFAINKGKSSRPDVFSAKFYQSY